MNSLTDQTHEEQWDVHVFNIDIHLMFSFSFLLSHKLNFIVYYSFRSFLLFHVVVVVVVFTLNKKNRVMNSNVYTHIHTSYFNHKNSKKGISYSGDNPQMVKLS